MTLQTASILWPRFWADRTAQWVSCRREPGGDWEYRHPQFGEWYTLPTTLIAAAEAAANN